MAKPTSGTVILFVAEKGYGFLATEGGKDIFFHISAVQAPAPKTIRAGQAVEFTVEKSPKGSQAVNVVFIK